MTDEPAAPEKTHFTSEIETSLKAEYLKESSDRPKAQIFAVLQNQIDLLSYIHSTPSSIASNEEFDVH
jgi:hypothetical protein